LDYYGNKAILDLPKTAFLCSRIIPASAVLKCYDWAIAQREYCNCIISGFQSKIEKDVFHYLIRGSQPLIVALARGMKQKMEQDLLEAIACNRLLIISPFEKVVRRVTLETAEKRSRLMIEYAEEIVFGYMSKGGQLERLHSEYKDKKKFTFL
jgi:hypothetical protein